MIGEFQNATGETPITAIVKARPVLTTIPRSFDVDAHILAMWLLYGSRPRNAEPDETGAYYIGNVEEPGLQHQHMERETPYSVCRGIRREP
jgi:hypothetical protein